MEPTIANARAAEPESEEAPSGTHNSGSASGT